MFNIAVIEAIITAALQDKFRTYKPETTSMPFHTRLLGRDRMALYSFIHSISTNFGMAIFEKIAVAIAKDNFDSAASQQSVGNKLTMGSQAAITTIMNQLSSGEIDPNHAAEMAILHETAQVGAIVTKKIRDVDLLLTRGNTRFLIDLKTAKPNLANFEGYKQMMLEWTAATLREHPDADVRTIIAIPYNPYEPKPYVRWTIKGMLDIKDQSQLMVGSQFWDFLAGEAIYDELLACFERVGIRMRPEIDNYFNRFLSK